MIHSKEGYECLCKSGFTNYEHKKMKCTGYYLKNTLITVYDKRRAHTFVSQDRIHWTVYDSQS